MPGLPGREERRLATRVPEDDVVARPHRPARASDSRPAKASRCRRDRAPSHRGGRPTGGPRRPRASARRTLRRAPTPRHGRPMGRCRRRRAEKASVSAARSAANRSSSRMPLATAKAITSGTAAPPAAKAARPASRPAWVPPLEVAWTTAAVGSRRRRSGRRAPRARRRTPQHRPRCSRRSGWRTAAGPPRSSPASASLALSSSPQSSVPGWCASAPNRDDRSWLPAGRSGAGPPSTRWTSRPSRAPAAAVMRQWFDWPAPTVTRVSAPSVRATPQRCSSLRALLPPIPRPVRSSRFTQSRAPPGSNGPSSSGVGSVASAAAAARDGGLQALGRHVV